MQPRSPWVAVFGLLASTLALAMIALALAGTSQEAFETILRPPDYARALVEHGPALRVVFALDDLFLLSYCSFFVAYYAARRAHADPVTLRLVLGAVLAAGLLDAVENFHIRAMLVAAESGELPSAREIELQYVLSAVKFTIGYFAAIGFALTYPRHDRLARAVALSTGVGFPVLGVLVFAAPPPWSNGLALARVLFFASGYALSALVFWPRAKGDHDSQDHGAARLARETGRPGPRSSAEARAAR